MLHKLLSAADKLADIPTADAHCDIPCKIYDPISAQIAALTIVRMVDLIHDLKDSGSDDPIAFANSMSRFVATKEEHGVKVKEEVRVIWGDYFKAPQMEKFPEIHDLSHSIMLLASASKQHVDRDKAVELVEKVNRFAEIFWATKGVEVKRRECPYPPSLELVYPDL
ncbi:MAG: superoxide dismutase, Ni [Pseudomonadota bacterium]